MKTFDQFISEAKKVSLTRDSMDVIHKKAATWIKKNLHDLDGTDKGLAKQAARALDLARPKTATAAFDFMSNNADVFLIDLDDYVTSLDKDYFKKPGGFKIMSRG